MDTIFIFIAEKLFLISPIIAGYFFYQMPRDKKIELVIFAFFALPLTLIISIIAKELYYNPLPFVRNGIDPLISHAPDNGFPSDHVLLLASIASIFTFFHRRLAIGLWIIAVVVGLARMYVGVHHLVDVAFAMCIALLASLVVYTVLMWRKSV